MSFDISVYSQRLANDINDIFYAKDNSLDSKVERIRNLAEIIGRFILDWGNEKSTSLGEIKEELAKTKSSLLMNALGNINKLGVDYAHTEQTLPASEKELEQGKDCLNDMYAYLFIRYFEKYEFGTNAKIERVFSLLPPEIRLRALNYLYENGGGNNDEIIRKLVLALLKTSNEKRAKRWLDKHKTEFQKRPSSVFLAMKTTFGDSWYEKYFAEDMPLNLYDECYLKIVQVNYQLKGSGKMYKTFEEAAKFYEINGKVDEISNDEKEFNRIMEFVYAGRKAVDNVKNPDSYISANIWNVSRIKN